MSESSHRGRNWIRDKLKKIKALFEVNEILDIATGAGTYSNRYRILFQTSNWTGIEVWEEFVEKFDLKNKYDQLIVHDARTFDYATLPKIDLAFAGNVLEHMTKQEAIGLVNSVLNNTRCLIVSVPVVNLLQDELEDNPYRSIESRRQHQINVRPDWEEKEFLKTFGDLVIAAHVDGNIGVYVLSTDTNFIETFTKLIVAVYTISLNEIKHVDRFMDSCKDADYVVVTDTGSTDGTVERLKERGAMTYSISQKPWRFDIARNSSLSLVPEHVDLCICLDLDEIVMPGWRNLLEKAWKDSHGTITRVEYEWIMTWNENGTPDRRCYVSKIHHRNHYQWKGACHEQLFWFGEGEEKAIIIPDLQTQHHPDKTKNRIQYLYLLEQAVKDEPENHRMRYFYADCLKFYCRYAECIQQSLYYLAMPRQRVWDGYYDFTNQERAAAYMNISECYRYLGNMKESQAMALKGVSECNTSRDPWLQLAFISQLNQDWQTSYWAATKCLEITTRFNCWVSRSRSWGSDPCDYAALAAYNLGKYQEAFEYSIKALELSPADTILQNNVEFYQKKI